MLGPNTRYNDVRKFWTFVLRDHSKIRSAKGKTTVHIVAVDLCESHEVVHAISTSRIDASPIIRFLVINVNIIAQIDNSYTKPPDIQLLSAPTCNCGWVFVSLSTLHINTSTVPTSSVLISHQRT